MKCKLGHEVESIETILSDVCSPEGPYVDLPKGEQFVVYLGFTERAVPCGHLLGEGYGDPNFFSTLEKASDFFDKVMLKFNQVIEDGVLNVS